MADQVSVLVYGRKRRRFRYCRLCRKCRANKGAMAGGLYDRMRGSEWNNLHYKIPKTEVVQFEFELLKYRDSRKIKIKCRKMRKPYSIRSCSSRCRIIRWCRPWRAGENGEEIMKKQYNERPTTIIVWLVVILAIIVMIAFTGIKPAM